MHYLRFFAAGILFLIFQLSIDVINAQAHKKGSDHVFTLNSASNSLYVGIDNHVIIRCKHNSSNADMYVKVRHGKVFREDTTYLIIPERAGFLDVHSYFVFPDTGDTLLHDTDRLSVMNVPQPVILLNGQNLSKITAISKYDLIDSEGFTLFFSDDILDASAWYSIDQISMSYAHGSNSFSFTNEGPAFSDEMKQHIAHILPGKDIVFRIRIKSPEQITKYIPLFIVQVY